MLMQSVHYSHLLVKKICISFNLTFRLHLLVPTLTARYNHLIGVYSLNLRNRPRRLRPLQMYPPPGFPLPPGKCYSLKRSLYGLRQASHLYHKKLHAWHLAHKFEQLDEAGTMFRIRRGSDTLIAQYYVEDCIVFAIIKLLLVPYCTYPIGLVPISPMLLVAVLVFLHLLDF